MVQFIWVLCVKVSLMRLWSRCQWRLHSRLKIQSGGEFPSALKHVAVGRIWFLVCCRSEGLSSSVGVYWKLPLVLCHMGLSIRQFTTWNLASFRASWRGQTIQRPQSFYNLISEGPSHHSCTFLFIRSEWLGPIYFQGEKVTQGYEHQ